jgi:amino acid adenylation domain-containing protein
MSETGKHRMEMIGKSIMNAREKGVNIFLPGNGVQLEKHTAEQEYTPGFIYRSASYDGLLMLEYDEYEKQLGFLNNLLPLNTADNIWCTATPGFFSKDVLSNWAEANSREITYSEYSLHETKAWKNELHTMQPSVWIATEAELKLLLAMEDSLPAFVHTVIVINAIQQDEWLPVYVEKAAGTRFIFLIESDILPGFSFYRDIDPTATQNISKSYHCIRPEKWMVTKNGKKASSLIKGVLTAYVQPADRNITEGLNVETPIAARMQAAGFDVTFPTDMIVLPDGACVSFHSLRTSILNSGDEITDVKITSSNNGLFAYIIQYDAEDIIPHYAFNIPTKALFGIKKALNRALMNSEEGSMIDDSTLSILSAYHKEGESQLHLFMKTKFPCEPIPFPATARKEDEKEEADNVTTLAQVDAPMPFIHEGFSFTLTGHLQKLATTNRTITFVKSDEEEQVVSYSELFSKASKIAGGLQALSIDAQTPILIQLDDQADWITLYWAILLNKCIAAPLAVPKVFTEENDTVQKLKNIIGLLDNPVVVCDHNNFDWYQSKFKEWGHADVRIVIWEDIAVKDDAVLPEVLPEDVALYMFTSGSTGLPKCIMQTHRALVFRNYAVGQHCGFSDADIFLNWMPLDHIGGIQMSHNNAVVNGAAQVCLPIELIISNPVYWLSLIDKYRASYTWSPNFAFGLLQQEAETIKNGQWDLSCMKHWLTGGESVSAFVTREVIALLQPHGLDAYAVYPAYGMSETCSGITHAQRFDSAAIGLNNIAQSSMSKTLQYHEQANDETVCLVEVGPPVPGVSIRITDRNNKVIGENTIGLLQVKGPTITKGYLKNEEANAQLLPDGWFNTGDLGFIKDGVLTVTGREKDLIIINGLNYQNHEIERYIEEIPEIGANSAIAASYFEPSKGKEILYIFLKTGNRNYKEIATQVRNVLVKSIGIIPDVVAVLREQDFLVTASGKKRRPVQLETYLSGEVIPLYDTSRQNKAGYDNSLFFEDAWFEMPIASNTDKQGRWWLVTDADALTAQAKEQQKFDAVYTIAQFTDLLNNISETDTQDVSVCLMPATMESESFHQHWLEELTLLKQVFKTLQPAAFHYITQGLRSSVSGALQYGHIPGLLQSIAEEAASTRVRWVDTDAEETHNLHAEICAELSDSANTISVSWQQGKRYQQAVKALDANSEVRTEARIKQDGFYLITGGFGGVGSYLLKKLVAQCNIKALVICRTNLETKEVQASIFDFENRAEDRLSVYQSLPAANIIYRSCNIADKQALQNIVADVEKSEGIQLDGYFHLAGVARLAYHWEHVEEHLFTAEDARVYEWMLQSKVLGTINLEEIFDTRTAFLRVVFGSVNAYFGANSFSTYAAVNSFIRFYTAQQNKKHNKEIYSIHWSQWKGLGMSEDNQLDMLSANRGYAAIEPAEGWKALQNVLRLEPGNYISGLQPQNTFIKNRVLFPAVEETLVAVCKPSVTNKRLAGIEKLVKLSLSSWRIIKTTDERLFDTQTWSDVDMSELISGEDDNTPLTPIQSGLAEIWKDLLGVEKVLLTDNFFQLGGHSIKATRMIARVKDKFHVQLPFASLFKYPSLEELAEHVEQAGGSTGEIIIPQIPAADFYALSPAQYRLWMVHKMEGGADAYLVPGIYDIEGELDNAALAKAIEALVDKHEILRTVFVEQEGKPYQKVLGNLEQTEYYTYWTEEADVDARIRKLVSTGFNLNGGLLFHCHIFRIADNSHRLLVLLHHINADGVTLAILRSDLVAFYHGLVSHSPATYNIPPIQYKDFSAWYNNFLASNEATALQQYWLEKFSAPLPVLDMPVDYPRPLKQSFSGSSVETKLNTELTNALEAIAHKHKLSLFAVLASLVKTILWRHSGQDDVIVGTSVDLRVNAQLEAQAGQYVNVLALRDRLDTELTFEALLQNVNKTLVDALEHKLYPFEKLVNELELERDTSRNPLFSILLVMHNFESNTDELEGTKWQLVHSDNDTSKFDYVFAFRKEDDGLLINLRYCTDLFLKDRVQNLLTDITALAKGVVADCARPLKSYTLGIDKNVHAASIQPFVAPYFQDAIQRFIVQADKNPAHTAIICDGIELTYQELYTRAMSFAALCYKVEGQRIVVAKNPGIDWIAALLGIWVAGKTYVPVDASFPQHIITSQLLQVQPAAIIADATHVDKIKACLANAGVVNATIYVGIEDADFDICSVDTDWINEAYIVFTSGSTGKPKGIVGNRQSLSHFINWETQLLELDKTKDVKISQLTQPTFDASFRDIFLALATGNTLVIPDKDVRKDLTALLQWLTVNKVHVIHTVPSLLRAILQGIDAQPQHAIQAILCAGEQLYKRDVDTVHNKLGGCIRVINLYGATESTLVKTYWDTSTDWNLDTLPAGNGIADCNVVVVNESGILCAPGEAGEVLLRTPYLSKGYLDKNLDADSFIQNPLHNEYIDIVYRTGDIGRFTTNGVLQLAGRKDEQVKVNGVRLELKEIEQAALGIPGISEAVVKAWRDKEVVSLALYYTSASIAEKVVQEELQLRLSQYAMPSAIVRLDTLPVNANGKVNKNALLLPTQSATPTETKEEALSPVLLSAWLQTLKIEKDNVDTTKDFFRSGGNSLLAMILLAKLQQLFGTKIPIEEFFRKPTLSYLQTYAPKEVVTEVFVIKKLSTKTDYALSHAQQRMWILNEMETNNITYNVKRSYNLVGNVNVAALQQSFELLIKRHEILRTSFHYINGEVRQQIHEEFNIESCFTYKDITETQQPVAIAQEQVDAFFAAPFRLDTCPLIKLLLLKTGEEQYAFAIVKHHIISDGWSMEVVAKELIQAYNQIISGKSVAFDVLPFQYKDYAAWQNEYLSGKELGKDEAYWCSKLKSLPEPIELPADRPRFAVKTYNGDLYKFSIDAELSGRLRTFSETQQATVFMLMLTAVKALFSRYTGQTDIIIGTPTAGRRVPGVENQVGFYVNTLALRTQFNATDSFAALLDKVKKTTLEGLEHQDYPFDKLIDVLQLEKRMDHSPLFDVVVQFMNTSVTKESPTSFDGLTVEPFEAKWHTSQFDQNFFFTETEQGIQGVVEFNTDLFDKSTIIRQVQHLQNILSVIVNDANIHIHQIQFLTEEEKIAHNALQNTQAPYPHHTLYQQFEIAASKFPAATAITTTKGHRTYGELKVNADKLASLLSSITVGKNCNVVLLMDEGPDAVTAMLAALKAGCCYVPVAVTFPYERMKYMVEDSESAILLFSKKYLKEAGKLYWDCAKLNQVICIDSNDIAHEVEPEANIMSEELWDFVGQSATDDITGGAWFSSYTGLPISRLEMDEYANNAYKKLQPYLNSSTRVLEVGCASAITMGTIAPLVQHYTGADLSANILDIAKRNLTKAGITNHDLVHAAAHDVCKSISGKYDVLIFNSVIQCFSGYNYFRNVIESLLPFLTDKAVIFFGDIQDLDKKEALEQSLRNYAVEHNSSKVKLDWSQELFIPKQFFEELPGYYPELVKISHSSKIATVENELTRFRYDTIVEIDKTVERFDGIKKSWFDAGDITSATTPVEATIELDTAAYIIYTSGSTGNPKGCVITHRNLIRLFINDKMPFMFTENDVWIQSHGYHFDFSVWEIYGALLYGGNLVIPTREEIRDISAYYNLLKKHKVTVLNNTPRAFYNFAQYLLDNNDPHDIATHLRYVVFGGEKLQPDRLKGWMEKFPSVAMVNMYGITETTVHVTYHTISMQQVMENPYASIIGLPIPETEVYLKDAYGNDVPFNVQSEMNIGGTGVAAGYYNRAELTAEKFADNLYSNGKKIYRSGDFGKLQPDGNLVYINRRDAQVKIRGYRIETGEIEAALLKYPDIKQTAVIVKTDNIGDNSLIAYYTGAQAEADALRKYMAMHLPSYMVPTAFVHLQELPVTINGKLDVKKLPDPTADMHVDATTEPGELTPTEQMVRTAFCEVLGREQVGMNDNFFDLGGHSLKAMNLMSLMHSRIKVGVPLVYLYKFPTVKEIAHYIDCARYMNIQYKEHPYIQLGNPEGKRTVILFPPALGSALAYSHLASLLDDTRLFSFNYVDSSDTMQNYVRLLNEIQPEGDLYIAGHSAGGFMAFHVAKAMEKSGRKVGGIIILDAFRQGKEGKYHTHETIMEGVDQYLAYKFEEYKDHFIDMDFFKEVCYNQVKQYYDFLFHAEQEGDIFIQAPIHFMIAENNYERQENWTPCTAGGVKVYYASGIHGKMVDEPWVRPNADIMNDIIKQQNASL